MVVHRVPYAMNLEKNTRTRILMCAYDERQICTIKLSIFYYLDETETGNENDQNRCEL